MNKLKEYFESLEEREKNILSLGIIFVLSFVLINFIIIPVFDYKNNLESGVNALVYQANEIRELGKEYRKITGNLNLKSGGSNIELLSFMDSLAGKTGIKNNIDYMKPSKEDFHVYTIEKVELKVSEIDMKSLVSFIHGIESSTNNINIKGITIRKSDKGGTINSTIQAEIIKTNA